MKKKELLLIIKKMIIAEVKREVRKVLLENELSMKKKPFKLVNNTSNKIVPSNQQQKVYSKNDMINSILSETAYSMTNNTVNDDTGINVPDKTISGAPLNKNAVPKKILEVLNRDYSGMFKKDKKRMGNIETVKTQSTQPALPINSSLVDSVNVKQLRNSMLKEIREITDEH